MACVPRRSEAERRRRAPFRARASLQQPKSGRLVWLVLCVGGRRRRSAAAKEEAKKEDRGDSPERGRVHWYNGAQWSARKGAQSSAR